MSNASTYYQRDGITIHHGDCLEVLPILPSESVDFVLTDPPYLVGYRGRWDGAKTQIAGDDDPSWLRPAFTEIWRLMKPVSHLAFVKRQWGLGRFTWSGYETAFLQSKGHLPKPEVAISDVFDWHRDKTALHPNQKPVASMAAILHAYCPPNGIVLNPFMGSGSTLRAAKNLDLQAIGVEIDEDYCKKAAARMAQGILTSLVQIETVCGLPDLVQLKEEG